MSDFSFALVEALNAARKTRVSVPSTVITFGTFDVFQHHGHLRLLERAAQFGDKTCCGSFHGRFEHGQEGPQAHLQRAAP